MTVHPLPAEPSARPVSRPMYDTGIDVSYDATPDTAEALPIRSPRRRTSIRRNWVLATVEHGSTDRRAA